MEEVVQINTQVILLTGPSGVGKTSLAYEMVAILKEHHVGHAMIDTDELDRMFPEPDDSDELFISNLRAVWHSFVRRGCDRLILCAVLKGATEVPQDILDAISLGANKVQMFRLQVSDDQLRERLTKREIGSLLDQHIESSKRAASLNSQTDDKVKVIVNNRDIRTVAIEVLDNAGWINN